MRQSLHTAEAHEDGRRSLHNVNILPIMSIRLSDSRCNRTYTLHNAPATRGSEGFYSKIFAFFHFGLVIVLDQQHGLPAMYLVCIDGVTTEIFD